jgi:hypothetical protein
MSGKEYVQMITLPDMLPIWLSLVFQVDADAETYNFTSFSLTATPPASVLNGIVILLFSAKNTAISIDICYNNNSDKSLKFLVSLFVVVWCGMVRCGKPLVW